MTVPAKCPVCGGWLETVPIWIETVPIRKTLNYVPHKFGELHWVCETCGVGGPVTP
jgi:hypothetical protein